MKKPISDLRDKHEGEDIWVIASGPSMNYIDPAFFLGKVVIGINEVYQFFPCTYVVWKESRDPDPEDWGNEIIIASRFHCGDLTAMETEMRMDHFVFEHLQNLNAAIDFSVIGSDKIVVSYSTITSAMHIAAYMGAPNVLLCGHDCGVLDGQMNLNDYPASLQGDLQYRQWVREIEPQTLALRDELLVGYNCRVYSLNPFINLGMEDHEYKR